MFQIQKEGFGIRPNVRAQENEKVGDAFSVLLEQKDCPKHGSHWERNGLWNCYMGGAEGHAQKEISSKWKRTLAEGHSEFFFYVFTQTIVFFSNGFGRKRTASEENSD